LSLVENVDFIRVLGWLDVDDGLGGSPTSSRDHDVVLRVDAGWLDEDHLLASLSARNIESVLLDVPHIFRCHFAVDGNSPAVSSLRSATTTESLPKSKGLSLDLWADYSNSSVSRSHTSDQDLYSKTFGANLISYQGRLVSNEMHETNDCPVFFLYLCDSLTTINFIFDKEEWTIHLMLGKAKNLN
jgi:hypothetical protein